MGEGWSPQGDHRGLAPVVAAQPLARWFFARGD